MEVVKIQAENKFIMMVKLQAENKYIKMVNTYPGLSRTSKSLTTKVTSSTTSTPAKNFPVKARLDQYSQDHKKLFSVKRRGKSYSILG